MGNVLMILFLLGFYGILTLTLIGAWAQSEWLVFGITLVIALPFYGIPAFLIAAVIAEYRRQAQSESDNERRGD